MRIPLWPRHATKRAHLGVAAFLLIALLPLQHSGVTLAGAGRDGIDAQTASLEYVGTSDPVQLAATAHLAVATSPSKVSHHALPFLTQHRAALRSAAVSAIPQLANATVQQNGTVPSSLQVPFGSSGAALGGFPTLSAADQFTTHVHTATYADLEPPDDGVCAGTNGQIVQVINNVGAVYSTQGALEKGPFTLESFFHDFAPFQLSDPRCVYDPVAKAYFAEEWSALYDSFGNVTAAHINLAVNSSGDATKPWSIFRFNAGNATTTGCPCLPDYTQLGFDQNGVYLSTNQFSSDLSSFVGDRITVIAKNALLNFLQSSSAPLPTLFTYDLPNDFTVQPAVSYDPVTKTDASQEYLVESLDPNGTGGNQLSVFAFTHESSLSGSTSPGTLVSKTIASEPFAMQADPATGGGLAAVQKGFYGAVTLNDDRVLQVINAAGELWAVLNTAVTFNAQDTDFVRSAAAWFKLSPSFSSGKVSATIAAQNYVAAPFHYFAYPALMVGATGRAAMVLATFEADPNFPNAGLTYPEVSVASGVHFGSYSVVARSPMPDIGFTTVLYPPDDLGGYPDYVAGGGRWGDYSAATIDPNGLTVYLNAEWIPGPATEGSIANWGTFMSRYSP